MGFFSVFFGSGHWATQEGLIWSIGKSVFPNFFCCSQKGRLFQAMMIGDDELTFLGKCHLSFSLCCTRKESFESNQCHMLGLLLRITLRDCFPGKQHWLPLPFSFKENGNLNWPTTMKMSHDSGFFSFFFFFLCI